MNNTTHRFFIKNTLFLVLVYLAFFIVFNIALNLDLNNMKTVLMAVFFALFMSSIGFNSELKNYKKLKEGKILIRELIPTAEGTLKKSDNNSIEKIRQSMIDNGFLEDETYADGLRYSTQPTWRNSIPMYVLIRENEGMLNIKLYKFTRTTFLEPLKSKDVLDKVKAIISSCS
jgi:hypothetical protein